MSRYKDDLKKKLAWQIAYEQRTCPPLDIISSGQNDANMRKHLRICATCRENHEISSEEKDAWSDLFKKMSSSVIGAHSGTTKQEGQVWSLKKSLSGWQQDGRYFSPPLILLIDKQGDSSWKVAQLCGNKRLAGDGDVPLEDPFGFAQGWNCYSLRAENFEKLLGMVKPFQLQQVLSAMRKTHDPPEEGSILSFFRRLEVDVANFVSTTAVITQPSELIPGLRLLVTGAKEYVIDIAADTLGLLRGTFKPAVVMRGAYIKPSAPKLTVQQKQLIVDQCPIIPIDVKISGSAVLITLKWISDPEQKASKAEIVANESVLTDVNIFYGAMGIVKISSSDPNIAELELNKTSSIRLKVLSDLISIDLSPR